MIVFNGLYFKGSFVTPFQTTKNQTDGVFYTSEKEKLPAEMMNALGNFQYGELTDLDAKAIELPYEVRHCDTKLKQRNCSECSLMQGNLFFFIKL